MSRMPSNGDVDEPLQQFTPLEKSDQMQKYCQQQQNTNNRKHGGHVYNTIIKMITVIVIVILVICGGAIFIVLVKYPYEIKCKVSSSNNRYR